MPAPNDLTRTINLRIALAKGWIWVEEIKIPGATYYAHWEDTSGQWKHIPDWTWTLAGLVELMRELQSRRKPMSQWAWYWNEWKQRFVMRHTRFSLTFRRKVHAVFYSDAAHPGDCVGDAWLSVFEKEDVDGN